MNTANLQIEGVLLAIAAICSSFARANLVDSTEMEAALRRAEFAAERYTRHTQLGPAQQDAIAFPMRFLREALAAAREGRDGDFGELAARVGRNKPDTRHATPAGCTSVSLPSDE